MEKKDSETKLKENWNIWEEQMGNVFFESGCNHVCSATDCTGLIPMGQSKDENIYKKYNEIYPCRPKEENK